MPRTRRAPSALEARVRKLEAQLGKNASNSSLPRSANPPQAPPPVVKTPTGASIGEELLMLSNALFRWRHRVRDGTLQRRTFQTRAGPQLRGEAVLGGAVA